MGTRHPRRLPSAGTVIACIALFVSLGGTSYALAVGSIGSREIRDDSIRTRDVHNRSLKGSDLAPDSVGGGAIREETLDASKLDLSELETPPPSSAGVLLRALVERTGRFSHDRGVANVEHLASGQYNVAFDRDVSECVPVATSGPPRIEMPRLISIEPDPENPLRGLRVSTVDHQDGSYVDRSFFLLVSC